jgi:hypothetical protein
MGSESVPSGSYVGHGAVFNHGWGRNLGTHYKSQYDNRREL